MKGYILTCDAGTTGCKCALIDRLGATVMTVTRSYTTKYPRPGWAEQNPDDVSAAVFECFREIVSRVGAQNIACIGLSGTMNGCIPVDAEGRALYPNIIHSDTRTGRQTERIESVIAPNDFYTMTGNRIDTHYTLPKILWFRDERPDIYSAARWWLNTKDYIYGKLTGRFGYTDYSDASLTIALDINRRVWAEELLTDLKLDADKMPRLTVGHDITGVITTEVAHGTGLLAGTPVAMGGGDGACTARGAGVCAPGSGYTYIGSSAWVSQIRYAPVFDPEMRIFNYLDMDGRSYHVCGTVQCGAAAFDWARDNLLAEDTAVTEAMAREIAPGAEGVMFLPTLMGWRTPYWDDNTRGALVGFTLYHDRRHVARAVYEGVGYAMRMCAEIMVECGAPIAEMTLTGGGALSGIWPGILSAMYGMETRVHGHPSECTSIGAAIAAGVGAGIFESYEAASAITSYGKSYLPETDVMLEYDRYYPIFKGIYDRVKPINDSLAGM